MKRFSLWLLFFAVLGVQSVLAQSYRVKGNVVSKTDNEPLIGVSILQKGTTNGVVTDIDGNYELQIQGGDATLVFSYIGMQTQELKVNAKTGILNVVMTDDSQMMDDVVVVAYGVRKGNHCGFRVYREERKVGKCSYSQFRSGITGTNSRFDCHCSFR